MKGALQLALKILASEPEAKLFFPLFSLWSSAVGPMLKSDAVVHHHPHPDDNEIIQKVLPGTYEMIPDICRPDDTAVVPNARRYTCMKRVCLLHPRKQQQQQQCNTGRCCWERVYQYAATAHGSKHRQKSCVFVPKLLFAPGRA